MKPQPSPSKLNGDAAFAPVAASLCAAAIAFLAGCATEPESHIVSAPPPPAPTATVAVVPSATATANAPTAVVTTTTATPTQQGVVVVTQAPPSPQPEAVPARPSSDHLWVPGFWTWRNSRYEWMAGHWEVPPRAGARWVNPRWEPENGSYRFYEGYWAD
jgi:hypothetical protein